MSTVNDPTVTHTHTFSWEDGTATVAAGATMSGLEIWQAVAAGELPPPPIGAAFGFGIPEVEEGRIVFEADAQAWMGNPLGTVHGGAIATLLDSAVGCAVHTTCPAGVGYTTVELGINYVGGVRADHGTLRAEGRILHRGRSIATAEGRLTVAATGKLVAHATTTCMILDHRG